MTGKGYTNAVIKLDIQGLICPEAHMFAQEDFYQAKHDLVIEIMTHISLKSGLKYWGYQAHSESKSEMKQLDFMNMFIPMYRFDLTYK